MIIYKVTNRINGMVYIGKTTKTLEERWLRHRRAVDSKHAHFKLQAAIKEFGVNAFVAEEIESVATNDEANEREVYWIKYYNSIEHGYNTSRGGKDGGKRVKVMNVETGEVFDSMVEAGKHYGVATHSIFQAVKNPTWVCCGYHWRKFS